MSEHEAAAERRADYVRALREEMDGYSRTGRKDRAKEVQVELDRVLGKPAGRSEHEPDEAPKRTTRRAKG